MSRRFKKEIHEFMKEYIPGHTQNEVSEQLMLRYGIDMTPDQVHSYKNNHRIKSGTAGGIKKGTPSKVFHKEVADYIKNNCEGTGPSEMTDRLNEIFGKKYTKQQVTAYYKNHGIKSGLTGRFEKGHVPYSKGKKMENPSQKFIEMQFKSGGIPWNTKQIGDEIVKGDGYLWRKIGPGRRDWKQVHRILWEEKNGPIPEGHKVIFLDGDRTNISLDNLLCVSNQVHVYMAKKGLRFPDADLTKAAAYVAILQREIINRSKCLTD